MDFVKMSGGKTQVDRYHDVLDMDATGFRGLKTAESFYSDVFQVRAPLGPGGYARESQYAKQDALDYKMVLNYKMIAKIPGDDRPFWRVAW